MTTKQTIQAEVEVKFTDVDIEDVRTRLKQAGASLEQPMRAMRRVLIEEPQHAADHSFIRIRDEGDKTTLTFKRHTHADGPATVDSVHELETTVGDFDTTVAIFAEAGWKYTTFQESKRETWRLDDVEVVIDSWPWIKPYIEIEGSDEAAVRRAAERLGFDWSSAMFGSVDVIYQRDYPDRTVRGVIDIREVRFDDPVPIEFVSGEHRS